MSDFVDYLHEALRGFGPVQARRMFGGHGLFRDGLMFGLVANDSLYLKADAQSAPAFEALALARFEYARQGKTAYLSYYLAPAEVLEDPEQAAIWARRAFDAALRAQAASARRQSPRRR